MSETRTWATVYADDSRAEILFRFWMKSVDQDAGFEDREVTDPDNWSVINESAEVRRGGKILVFSTVTRR